MKLIQAVVAIGAITTALAAPIATKQDAKITTPTTTTTLSTTTPSSTSSPTTAWQPHPTDCYNHLSANPSTHALTNSPAAQSCLRIAEMLATSLFLINSELHNSATRDKYTPHNIMVTKHWLDKTRGYWGISEEAVKGVDVFGVVGRVLEAEKMEAEKMEAEKMEAEKMEAEKMEAEEKWEKVVGEHEQGEEGEEDEEVKGEREVNERGHGECIPGFSWGC